MTTGVNAAQTELVEFDKVEIAAKPAGIGLFVNIAVTAQVLKVCLAPKAHQGGQQHAYELTLRGLRHWTFGVKRFLLSA